jgi:hypothetical protein
VPFQGRNVLLKKPNTKNLHFPSSDRKETLKQGRTELALFLKRCILAFQTWNGNGGRSSGDVPSGGQKKTKKPEEKKRRLLSGRGGSLEEQVYILFPFFLFFSLM